MTKYRYDKARRTVLEVEEEPELEQLMPLSVEELLKMLKTMQRSMDAVFREEKK